MSHPLKVEQVFFEGLSCLRLLALIHNVWILFVATALVILAAMSLPITQTHPAEIYTATTTLLLQSKAIYPFRGIRSCAFFQQSYHVYTWSIAKKRQEN